MHKLIEFIRTIYVFVFFVVLEILAINYYAHSTHYTQARLLTRANSMVGGVHGMMAGVRGYFHLRQVNDELLDHVARLSERLAGYEHIHLADSVRMGIYVDPASQSKFRVMHATVISNTVNRRQNLIVLNCGRKEGVTDNMTLVSPSGALVGYVADCTDDYAVAVSVLNTSMKLSGKLKHNNGLGSITWDGCDPEVVTMSELSKYAFPEVGQEVVTAGLEISFSDVPIGTIESVELNETGTQYTARVRLAAPFSSLTDLLLIERIDQREIDSLKRSRKIDFYYKN